MVDPISCQDSILVKKFLSKDIKKAKRERDDLINVLREGILISAVIEIKPSKPIKDKVKSFYFNLKDYKILDKSSFF
uniref:Uncharacterized protein n=1 Tax=Candidatus Phytoplasma australasiaticum subsp. australasiaticum TaxID=2832407 RepID=A0A7S7G0T2_9MOLU|nr:hypothetical protein H7685_00630 ['Parthenium hysterophorus' phyllody phytoplasma]